MNQYLYSPISLGDTKNLSVNEWLLWRMHGPAWNDHHSKDYIDVIIGGSDVAAALDMSPWKTSMELYNEKITGKNLSQSNDATFSGNLFEPCIAVQFQRKMEAENHNVTVTNDTNFYQCGMLDVDDHGDIVIDKKTGKAKLKYPFACGNIDRLVVVDGEKAILEIKTISSSGYDAIQKWKKGIVPINYELQCRYYMAVMNINVCYICCSWGYRLNEMVIIKIERDLSIEQVIMDKVAEFVGHVRNHIPPECTNAIGSLLMDYYKRTYHILDPKDTKIYDLPLTYRKNLLQIVDIDAKISEYNNLIKELEEEKCCLFAPIEREMLSEECMQGHLCLDADFRIDVKCQPGYNNGSFDKEKFKQDYPDIYDQFQTFDTAAFKSVDEKTYSQYVSKRTVDPSKPIKIVVKIHQPKVSELKKKR